MGGLGFPPFGVPPFGVPPFGRPPFLLTMFDTLPIGAKILVGADSSEWVGNYGGVVDGVLFLTNARLFSNIGNQLDGVQSVVRIPINKIQYVSY